MLTVAEMSSNTPIPFKGWGDDYKVRVAPKDFIEVYSDSQISKKHRLKLLEFCWRNYNFDAHRVALENSDTMMYI